MEDESYSGVARMNSEPFYGSARRAEHETGAAEDVWESVEDGCDVWEYGMRA